MNNISLILIFLLFNLILFLSKQKLSNLVNVYDLPEKRKIHK